MAIRIELDREKCQTYKRCTVVAPAVFVLGDDQRVQLADAGGAERDVILKAAKSCPYRVITVIDETSNEQLWPVVRT